MMNHEKAAWSGSENWEKAAESGSGMPDRVEEKAAWSGRELGRIEWKWMSHGLEMGGEWDIAFMGADDGFGGELHDCGGFSGSGGYIKGLAVFSSGSVKENKRTIQAEVYIVKVL